MRRLAIIVPPDAENMDVVTKPKYLNIYRHDAPHNFKNFFNVAEFLFAHLWP